MHSLAVNHDTNLLILVSLWLDNICHKQTKCYSTKNFLLFGTKQGLSVSVCADRGLGSSSSRIDRDSSTTNTANKHRQ